MGERENLIIASFLHDIGKFWQRTGGKYDSEYENLIHLCCPKYFDKEKKCESNNHKHVLWTGNFLKNFLLNTKLSASESIALYHYLPENAPEKISKLVKILALSDLLSSGERIDIKEKTTGVKNYPLVSIFSRVSGVKEGIDYKAKDWFQKLSYFELKKDTLFPVEEKNDAIDPNSYLNLWKIFYSEIDEIKDFSDFDIFLNRLYHILLKYTCFIPSTEYKSMADIPLFDHMKTTCAISVCLYDDNKEENELDKILKIIEKKYKNLELSPGEEEILKEENFILIGGDISGIQDFIYSITSKGAVKGLRGRSFYLQLLSEAIAHYILNNLNLPITNLLYYGGGHFYILSPRKARESLINLQKEIDEKILNAHRGKLSLILSFADVSFSDFDKANFGNKRSELGKKLAIEKRRKLITLLTEKYDDIFGPFEEGGFKKVCGVCGEEVEDEQLIEDKCNFCRSFENLAKDISRAKYIEISRTKQKRILDKIKKWEDIISCFGVNYKLIEKVRSPENTYLLNNTEFIKENLVGFKFIAKSTPLLNNKIKDFDKLADDSKGIKKWGILRADIDSLGKIFGIGLGENKTISRISTLSSLISTFFSSWIDTICSNFKDNVYLIYSGGDDLFIVGSWSYLPEIAEKIYTDFREYTCNNPNITLSSGIFIAPSKKFPAYQGAEIAGSLENKAKNSGKDRVTFLETPMLWKDQFRSVKEIKDRIFNLLKKYKVSRSLLQTLIASSKEQKLFEEGKDTIFRIWRILYVIKNFINRHKKAQDKLKELEKKIITDNKLKQFLNLAVRWAEFLTREG